MVQVEKQFEFWQKWLTYANGLFVLVGLGVAFAGNSFALEWHNNFTENLFFGGKELTDSELAFKNWLFGIIGATIVGFHLLMVMISEYAFRKKEPWAWWAMWLGLLSWFLIDSGISLYYGAVYNVVAINLVALILIGVPLLMTWPTFRKVQNR